MHAPHDDPLAESARGLVRGVRATEVGGSDRARAAAHVAEAVEVLGGAESPGPWWQTGFTSFVRPDGLPEGAATG